MVNTAIGYYHQECQIQFSLFYSCVALATPGVVGLVLAGATHMIFIHYYSRRLVAVHLSDYTTMYLTALAEPISVDST